MCDFEKHLHHRIDHDECNSQMTSQFYTTFLFSLLIRLHVTSYRHCVYCILTSRRGVGGGERVGASGWRRR